MQIKIRHTLNRRIRQHISSRCDKFPTYDFCSGISNKYRCKHIYLTLPQFCECADFTGCVFSSDIFHISGCLPLEHTCPNAADVVRCRRTRVVRASKQRICENIGKRSLSLPDLLLNPSQYFYSRISRNAWYRFSVPYPHCRLG